MRSYNKGKIFTLSQGQSVQHNIIQPVLVNELKQLATSTLMILTPPLFPLQCPVDRSLWSCCMYPLCQLSDVYTNTPNSHIHTHTEVTRHLLPLHIPHILHHSLEKHKETAKITSPPIWTR